MRDRARPIGPRRLFSGAQAQIRPRSSADFKRTPSHPQNGQSTTHAGFRHGETRTRTGDTTIFSRYLLAAERRETPGKQAVLRVGLTTLNVAICAGLHAFQGMAGLPSPFGPRGSSGGEPKGGALVRRPDPRGSERRCRFGRGARSSSRGSAVTAQCTRLFASGMRASSWRAARGVVAFSSRVIDSGAGPAPQLAAPGVVLADALNTSEQDSGPATSGRVPRERRRVDSSADRFGVVGVVTPATPRTSEQGTGSRESPARNGAGQQFRYGSGGPEGHGPFVRAAVTAGRRLRAWTSRAVWTCAVC